MVNAADIQRELVVVESLVPRLKAAQGAVSAFSSALVDFDVSKSIAFRGELLAYAEQDAEIARMRSKAQADALEIKIQSEAAARLTETNSKVQCQQIYRDAQAHTGSAAGWTFLDRQNGKTLKQLVLSVSGSHGKMAWNELKKKKVAGRPVAMAMSAKHHPVSHNNYLLYHPSKHQAVIADAMGAGLASILANMRRQADIKRYYTAAV